MRGRWGSARWGLGLVVTLGCMGCKSQGDARPAEPPREATPPADDTHEGGAMSSLELTSTAFTANSAIPTRYTCEGDDVSPPLSWSGAPEGVRSYALIIDDPDAPDPARPQRTWVHWVVYNIPASTNEFAEGAAAKGLPAGSQVGRNDWGKATYGGPCPPIGRHRYFHKLYALDTTLDLEVPTKAQVEQAMQSHVLGHAELVGTYQKGQ